MWDKFLNKLIMCASAARPHAPFIVLNTVRREIDSQAKSLLDVGCGNGHMIRPLLKGKYISAIGVDIDSSSLKNGRQYITHDGYVLCDARKLPFRSKSFDIVLCIEVLEHLDKEEGVQIIKEWEDIACRQVIITTPVGICDVQAGDGSLPYDVHKSSWYPAEFRELGYKVRGHGFSQLYGDSGLFARSPKILTPLLYILTVLVGPFVYYLPRLSGRMVCIKRLDSKNA